MRYFKHRLPYDWPVHLLILCGCLFAWWSIFSAVNSYRPEEKLTVFLCAREVRESAQLRQLRAAAEDAGILQLNLDCYDNRSDKYQTVLAVKGIYGSDVLILDEESAELFLAGGRALELSPAVLDSLLGDGQEAELLRTAEGRPAALRIWDGERGTGFGLECLELDRTSESYYLVINGRSVHAAPYAQGKTDAAVRLCRVLLSD